MKVRLLVLAAEVEYSQRKPSSPARTDRANNKLNPHALLDP